MPPKMLPKKKKGKAFGSFGQSLPSVDDSGEKGLSFGKALNTIKNLESSYAAENTSDSKTLTRKVSTITKEKSIKTLDKAVFSWTELSSNYLAFVENVYGKLKDVKESEPVNIDWTGLEHMTDAIFGCLLEKTRLPGYNHVLGIVLNGCCKLTDIGIRWLSQCFPKLKEVDLAGCLGVTETGVQYLLTNCSDLKSLDLTATNVMMLPSQIVGKDVDMAGCPLISPIESYLEQKGLDGLKDPNYKKPAGKNMLKVCLIRPHGFTTNVLPQITGEKVEKKVEVLFKPQVYLKNTDIIANIIEFEEGMIDKFVTKRSVILVPYEHDESKPVDNLVPWLLSVYCQVLTKVSRVSVLFVALVKDSNAKVNHHQAAFDVKIKAAKEKLLKQKKQLMEKKATKETPLTKLDQDNFSHTKELLDMLEVSSFTFTTAIKDSMKINSNLITEVLSACEKTIKLYPEYEELSSFVFQYACSDQCMNMFDSKDLTGALSLEGGALTSVKTMQLLHLLGRLLYLDIIDGPKMVMEIKWLSNLLSNLKPIENDGKFPCVSETTKVMSISECEQIVAQQKLGSKNSMALLPQLGLGMSTRNAYVAYAGLESDPPVNMNEFIGQEDDVQQICYKFNLAHSLATNVMNQIFTFSSYVRKPTMMWKNGIVLVENVTQTIVQLKNDKDSWFLELLVQTSKTTTGTLKETLPKALIHATEKLKIIIEYVLSSLRIPYQVELKEKLSQKPKGIHGIVLGHKIMAREGGVTLCKNCGTSTRQTNFLLELNQHLTQPNTSFELDVPKDPKKKDDPEKILQKKGKNIVVLKSELLPVEGDSALPGVMILAKLDPFEQPEISFTALEMDSAEDVKIQLRMGFGKTVALSYSLKTGELVQAGQTKKLYGKDHVGKIVRFKMSPLCEDDNIFYKLKIEVNGEVQTQMKIPAKLYVPVIVPDPKMKPADMKSIVMVHRHRTWSSAAQREIKPGMRLEALDRKTPTLICVATVESISPDGIILIHFDGWTATYDYDCDPSTVDIHPVGWFEAMRGETIMKKYNPRLQPPKGYTKPFHWPTYCEDVDCLPVPFEFFTEAQLGLCDSTAINEVYEHLGIRDIGGIDDKKMSLCSANNLPGTYLEYNLLSFKDQMNEELVGFYSNHRQFLCLLPEKFDVTHLRFPSLISVMSIQKQKVHFICPGHRMELLHLVDHGGLPLQHYLVESSDIDVAHLYAYLEMIYMGLLVQQCVLPWDLGKICPGVDSSTTEKLELLEMGFKRIFFQYLLWTHAYNSAISDANKAKKMDRSTILPAKVLKDEKSVKSLSSAFHISSGSSYIKCEGHMQSLVPNSDMKTINSKQFQSYAQFMHKFEFQNNNIESLPENFFTMFNHLSELNLANNKLTCLPEGFSSLKNLESLDISSNLLTALPKDFVAVKDSLENLNISSNPLNCIPPEIFMLENLEVLSANNVGKVNLTGIGKLSQLEKLYVGSNLIVDIPEEISSLSLTHLDLSGVPWFPEFLEQKIQPNLTTFKSALNNIIVFQGMSEEETKLLFARVDKDENGVLDEDEITEVNKVILELYPRFGRNRLYFHDTAISPVIWKLKTLKSLSLRFHAITLVPDNVKELTELEFLDVSHNPDMITLSAQLGGLPLTALHLSGCPSLRTPPKEIVQRGFSVVFGYLRRLQQGSVECKRTKLMVVGLGGAGKTSLIRAMTNDRFSAYHDYGEQITDGIDITTWNVPVPGGDKKSQISYSVWDFAGQTVYYNTHQFFLSNRACYLLLWNIRLGYEHAGLDFWLNSIACHAPKAPILVVGTHCDKVEKSKIPQKELKATYPQIASFHFVSSYSGEGIKELCKKLVEETLKQKYMGERIPEAWLSLEQHVLERRKKDDLIPFKDVKAMASKTGIIDEQELIQAVQFLHDLGSLQFFNTEFLRSLVVIVPQWIVDVMACVVTVHVGPIQEGKLLHKDMAVVWAKYPKELHPWLLRLTEEFDLTFPLSDEEANLVPCLLPDTEKEYYWPALDEEKSDIRQTKAIYNFKYLPAGLFNRAQVRLHQFAESGQLWKKGMFLKKNNHIAVIKQKGQTILEVKAQGFRPENILFLVDEVIATLISESYSGVYYDLMVPCIECQNLGMVDPSMFPASKIHRAVELNAPFLQCDKMFHVLSIPELKSLMPPNKTTEFDEHLHRSVMELKNLGEDVNISVLFCYSKLNIPDLAQEKKLVHPGNIIEDLRKDGFDVSICDNPETADVESLTIAFKSAQVILFGVSDEFCADPTCKKLLIFAKETLNKPILLVVIGSSLKFLDTSIGLNIADEVFVKMTDVGRYEPKIKELKESLKKKKSKGGQDDNPECFISYCWSNSHDAIAKGSGKIEGALGHGDPRKIATVLKDKKIQCWLDIERVGNTGLFDDIADGLRNAKVVVACVSDEYANSKNCKMEFRFAVAKLKIPTILAVVGTGYNWERSEIGMLAVGSKCPKINFQMQNDAGYLQLFNEIHKHIDINKKEESTTESSEERKKNAFGEILESAERQFLRLMIQFKEKSFTADYPRLVVINLFDKDKEKKKKEEEKKDEEKKEGVNECPETEELQSEENSERREPNYCFTLLCENEGGWHDGPKSIPFPEFTDNEDEETYLSMAAPYAARINSILRHTGQQIAVMTTPTGKQLQEKLESHASTLTSEDEVEKAYITMIKDVTGLDENHTYGGLKKTSLLNGKTLWLCEKHREKVGSITEQRYKMQLQPTQLEDENPQVEGEKTLSEVPVPKTPAVPVQQQQSGVAASSGQKTQDPSKNVFKTRRKSPMKRQSSQACSVM